MQQQFLLHLQKSGLCKPGDKIMLAVSGGMDSMVMLRLFQASGFTIAVVHCNFQLRGEESDGDEQLVKKVCTELQIPFFVRQFQTSYYAQQEGVSIQLAARQLRYAWFEALLQKEKFDLLATAHHLNDNLETVLLNFTRGTGLSGLCGIPEKNGKIIRPLLTFTRSVLKEYALKEHLTWREDSSNESDDYQRNYIRHRVVPKLEELNPGLVENFFTTVTRLQAAHALATIQLEAVRVQYVTTVNNQIIINKAFATKVPYPAQVLWELVKGYGFNSDQCEDILLKRDAPSGKQFFSSGYVLVSDRKVFIISARQEPLAEILIEEGQERVALGKWTLTIENASPNIEAVDPLVAVFDADKVHFPLTWRSWQAGDYFYPLGMMNRKKISDFLIDQKVSRSDKATVTVLVSGGEILWVVGYRMDNRYKITPHTHRALRLSVTPSFFV